MFELHRSIKHLNEGFALWSKAFHLMEKEIGYYIDKNPFVFIYGKRNRYGAYIVIEKVPNGYEVVTLKDNKIINSNIIEKAKQAGLPDSKIMDFILKFAKDHDYLKKFTKMSSSDLAKFLIQKEGMTAKTFKELFPEIKADEGLGKVDLSGMNILGLEQFKKKDQERFMKDIEKAAGIVRKNGFGHLLYGDVFLVSGLKRSVAADYSPESDTVRFKIDSKSSDDYITRAFIHELGHRQYYKFKLDTNVLNEKWFEVKDKKPGFEIGTVFVSPSTGESIVVDGTKYGRGEYNYTGYYESDPSKKVSIPRAMAANPNLKILKGKVPDIDKFHVSAYAMTNPSEFWAEVFSFALTGQDKELLSWVKKATK